MTCENCLGLLIISITCILISIVLLKTYFELKNQLTVYMVIFFFVTGLGFFIWFLSSELLFDIYAEIENVLLIIGILPQMVLLFFILTIFEISVPVRIIMVIASAVFCILYLFVPFLDIYFFDPDLKLYPIISSIIYISNIILFLYNWRENKDVKSLFFSIGLILNMMAMISGQFSEVMQGILLITTAIIWGFAYSGAAERLNKLTEA